MHIVIKFIMTMKPKVIGNFKKFLLGKTSIDPAVFSEIDDKINSLLSTYKDRGWVVIKYPNKIVKLTKVFYAPRLVFSTIVTPILGKNMLSADVEGDLGMRFPLQFKSISNISVTPMITSGSTSNHVSVYNVTYTLDAIQSILWTSIHDNTRGIRFSVEITGEI